MGNNYPTPVKIVKQGASRKLLYAFCEMQGFRETMEDAHTIAPTINGDDTRSFFGIYDGHCGNGASQLASEHLLQFVLAEKNKTELSEAAKDKKDSAGSGEEEEGVWKAAFLAFDKELRNLEKTFVKLDRDTEETHTSNGTESMDETENAGDCDTKVNTNDSCGGNWAISHLTEGLTKEQVRVIVNNMGGCTAITVYMKRTLQDDGWELTCANLGDSRAVLFNQNQVIPLSEDHKPSNPEEKSRIESAGGHVSRNRVDGDLALSRAFGDFSFKNESLEPHEYKIIAIPDVTHRIVKDDDDSDPISFVVLACDGIWDVFSNEDLVNTVRQHMSEIGLFDPNVPVPDKFLHPAKEMWVDKLVPDWNKDDQIAWIESQLSPHLEWSDRAIHQFFERARAENDFSEHTFDRVVAMYAVENAETIKKILFERIQLQETALRNPHPIPTTPEGKLGLVAKKIVDDAVFNRYSKDNISLTIVLLRNADHGPDMAEKNPPQ